MNNLGVEQLGVGKEQPQLIRGGDQLATSCFTVIFRCTLRLDEEISYLRLLQALIRKRTAAQHACGWLMEVLLEVKFADNKTFKAQEFILVAVRVV